MDRIKVAILDDHPMVVSGLKHTFGSETHIQVVGTFHTGRDLLEGLKKQEPDILLLDIQLPDMSGKSVAETICATYPNIKIIILSSLETPDYVEEMMTFGCSGYLLKSATDHDQLITAVETVFYGKPYLQENLRKELMGGIVRKQKKASSTAALLTNKEREILKLIIDGHSSKQIAELLKISVRTVETHRFSLLQKLDVKNAAELTKKAMELHLTK